MSQAYMRNLKSNTSYHVIMRAEDRQGEILITSAVFKTQSQSSLRFSEILVHAIDNQEEYVKFVYNNKEEHEFNNLKLLVERPAENYSATYILASAEKTLILKPGAHIWIGAKDFKTAKAAPDDLIININKKNIFANNKSSFIKVIDDNNIYDRFSGYLWPSPPGKVIKRRELWGLDEKDNYCYFQP
jgi:hypothetical protein